MWCESVSNSIKNLLAMFDQQSYSLRRAASASLCSSTFRKAATYWQTPEPISQIFVFDFKHRLKD